MTDVEILESLKSYTSKPEVIDRAIEALKQEPICETLTSGYVQEIKAECEDAISRVDLIRKLEAWDHNVNAIPNYVWNVIRELPSVNPQETVTEFADRCQECGEKYGMSLKFAEWVARELFDENWELNKDAFEELACRKLEKLGIVRANGDVWELVEP